MFIIVPVVVGIALITVVAQVLALRKTAKIGSDPVMPAEQESAVMAITDITVCDRSSIPSTPQACQEYYGQANAAISRLKVMALGNVELVDRLIAAERRRVPGLSLSDAAQAAIDRWERDLRSCR